MKLLQVPIPTLPRFVTAWMQRRLEGSPLAWTPSSVELSYEKRQLQLGLWFTWSHSPLGPIRLWYPLVGIELQKHGLFSVLRSFQGMEKTRGGLGTTSPTLN